VAQDGLDGANAKLSTLNGGPTQADLTAAQDAVNSANAGLNAARAKRDLVAAGSTSDDIKLQQTSVELAQLSVATAQEGLKKAQIIAPYDGTVASLNVHVGDMAGSGGSSSSSAGGTASASSSAPIVIDTPDAVQLQLTLGESDVTSVKVGDRGVATFDAMPGQSFPFTIDSIGGIPAVSQGVVTYTAQATMLTGAAALAAGFGPGGSLSGVGSFGRGAGLSGPGRAGGFARRTPGAGRTPAAGGTPFAGRTPGAGFGSQAQAAETPVAAPKPLPGMSASAVIEVQQVTNVLEVPATAVKRQGLDSVVDVMQADGTTKTVVIHTGLTDGTNIEVTDGVSEGDKVVLPSLAVSSGGSTNVSTTTGAAGRAAGGGGGGGGRFGGAGGGIAAPSNGIPGGVR
jgi:macrolide-specific efflux system membrane fusion protein